MSTFLAQSDYSSGMWRVKSRDMIPADGAYDLENCLIDDSRQAPRRGGTQYLTASGLGSTGLTFLWDGVLNGARRTLVANENDFGLLASDDASISNLGGAGLRFPASPAVVGNKLFLPGGVSFNGTALGTAAKVADHYCAAGRKLIACIGNVAHMSAIDDPDTFPLDENWQLPNGVTIIGAAGSRDAAVLFTTAGVWLISNLLVDLTDADGNVQQTLDMFSRDMVLWGESGIAGWQGGLVVPALDGVWLMNIGNDPATAPPPFQKISTPIVELYTEYVRAGYRPGGATVFRGNYLLPIMNGPSVVDVLVCRLDMRDSRGYPRPAWTHITGHGGKVSQFAVRVVSSAGQPLLLGAQRDASSKVSWLRYFAPDAPATDADGSVGRWQIVTRDYQTGTVGTKSTVLRVTAEYVLDPGLGAPVIEAAYAAGESSPTVPVAWDGTTWGSSTWESDDEAFTDLSPDAPAEVTGLVQHTWPVVKRYERIRFRLRCDDASGRAAIKTLNVFTRPTGRTYQP